MLIGNQYADNKVYRGIKHYDEMPLTSGDIHEYADTLHMKNAYIMNNLLGYGTLNTPTILNTASGISLSDPSVIMIDGDVALIQSDDDKPLVSMQSIQDAGISEGVVCILGWYQAITAGSTMRNYGGVDNSILENDLLHPKYNLQLSSRFQFRWFPIIIDQQTISLDTIEIEIENRDIDGNRLRTTSTISSIKKINSTFILEIPTSMASYSESDLYLIPLFTYTLNGNDITEILPSERLRAGSPFLTSESEPTGAMSEGTVWFNPTTREFKTYVSDLDAFISSASKMGFLQYQSSYIIEDEITTPQDIVIPIDISEFAEGDILRVSYEGLELPLTESYTVNYTDHTITLLEFTTRAGDHVHFTVTKIVEATDITNISETFINHMATTGSGTIEGHVKLTDESSDADASEGLAATPKLVSESKKLIDDVTGIRYQFGIENGLLYIEEV